MTQHTAIINLLIEATMRHDRAKTEQIYRDLGGRFEQGQMVERVGEIEERLEAR